jgi:hypothetical protein
MRLAPLLFVILSAVLIRHGARTQKIECQQLLICSKFEECEEREDMILLRRDAEGFPIPQNNTICENAGLCQCGEIFCEKPVLEEDYCTFAYYDHFVYNECPIHYNIHYADAHVRPSAETGSGDEAWVIAVYNFVFEFSNGNVLFNGTDMFYDIYEEPMVPLFISFVLEYSELPDPEAGGTCTATVKMSINGVLKLTMEDLGLKIFDEGNPLDMIVFLNEVGTVIEEFAISKTIPSQDRIMEFYQLVSGAGRTCEEQVCEEGPCGNGCVSSGYQTATIVMGIIIALLVILLIALLIWLLFLLNRNMQGARREQFFELQET